MVLGSSGRWIFLIYSWVVENLDAYASTLVESKSRGGTTLISLGYVYEGGSVGEQDQALVSS
ncbi:hypothetical protein SLEP1_g34653 [Rubroshorea leprosula]|uniref:Uncharacterized protein n=1 Tax=Rubroshorea leprosula TaxID=152421 RepID=A0AAV5KL07_9ROSI|nr:hypothetical protein SLEP1_g34653 [Rubroshorea leprosula]